MVNPLASCFEWFIQFVEVIPQPCKAFMGLVLAVFFISSILRWFF